MEATTPKKRTTTRRAPRKSTASVTPIHGAGSSSQSTVCHACNALPVGSVELTALMLVLVFSLSAVLFTSVYALQSEQHKVAELEASTASLIAE